MRNIILGTIIVLALVFIIGSVGAFEKNNIGADQLCKQVGIALVVKFFAIGAIKD